MKKYKDLAKLVRTNAHLARNKRVSDKTDEQGPLFIVNVLEADVESAVKNLSALVGDYPIRSDELFLRFGRWALSSPRSGETEEDIVSSLFAIAEEYHHSIQEHVPTVPHYEEATREPKVIRTTVQEVPEGTGETIEGTGSVEREGADAPGSSGEREERDSSGPSEHAGVENSGADDGPGSSEPVS